MAIAVSWGFSDRKEWSLGRAAEGLARESRRNSRKLLSRCARLAFASRSSLVPALMATQILLILLRMRWVERVGTEISAE